MAIPRLPVTISFIYMESGQLDWDFRKSSGCSTAFHPSIKFSTMAAKIPAYPSGTPIFQKICQAVAPSSLAASRSSLGTS